MKIKVTHPFRDINHFSVIHQPGEVVDVDEGRAANIIRLGLGVSEEPTLEPTPEPKDVPPAETIETPAEGSPTLPLEEVTNPAPETPEKPAKKPRKSL